jgi:hypothetical protein
MNRDKYESIVKFMVSFILIFALNGFISFILMLFGCLKLVK